MRASMLICIENFAAVKIMFRIYVRLVKDIQRPLEAEYPVWNPMIFCLLLNLGGQRVFKGYLWGGLVFSSKIFRE